MNLSKGKTYSLNVSYESFDVKSLETYLSYRYAITDLFDVGDWLVHKSCANVDLTPGERVLRLARIPVKFNGKSIEEAFGSLVEYFVGYRFALDHEVIAFAKEHPEIVRKSRRIYALGNMVSRDSQYAGYDGRKGRDERYGELYFLVLKGSSKWLDVWDCAHHELLHSWHHLLLVRKD
ncbi:hypothetical protein K8R04_02640 [Candidatus Uhrbacteria bacterium]|nr:hypothetical protein [Candidatus Uhrbacteria bacterium]